MKRRKNQEKEVLSYQIKKVSGKVEFLNLNNIKTKLQLELILIMKIKFKILLSLKMNCKKVWLKCLKSTKKTNRNQLSAIFLKPPKISLICLSMNCSVLRYLLPVQTQKFKRVIDSKLKIKHFQVLRA